RRLVLYQRGRQRPDHGHAWRREIDIQCSGRGSSDHRTGAEDPTSPTSIDDCAAEHESAGAAAELAKSTRAYAVREEINRLLARMGRSRDNGPHGIADWSSCRLMELLQCSQSERQ